MSGNYRLTVYDDNNEEEPMFTACFMVVDPKMEVGLQVTTNTDVDINHSHQQVAMEVSYNNCRVIDPTSQVKTVVLQNSRWDNAVVNAEPQYTMMGKGLKWDHNRALIFDAGNEYHKFEVLDTDHPTLGIDRIRWDGEYYQVFPFLSEPRPNYIYDEDADGSFIIRNSNDRENDTTCDYVCVNYRLKAPELKEGQIVIDGRWTTEEPETYVMSYDPEQRLYTAKILQKQGYYSYQYLWVTADGETRPLPSEGNFFQTENRYQAFVYYKGTGERTWRLTSYDQITLR